MHKQRFVWKIAFGYITASKEWAETAGENCSSTAYDQTKKSDVRFGGLAFDHTSQDPSVGTSDGIGG